MNAIPADRPEEEWDSYPGGETRVGIARAPRASYTSE